MKNLNSSQIIFCTRFDRNFILKAIVTLQSFIKHHPWAKVIAVCLDDYTYSMLTKIKLTGVIPVPLLKLENFDHELLKAKQNRGKFEYYWSLTPSLVLYVLKHYLNAKWVVYFDSDMFFYSSTQTAFAELGDKSIYTVEHRYPPDQEDRNRTTGRFNVAFQIFRRDKEAAQCLKHWRTQCLDNSSLDPNHQVVGDQMYLNEWPELYPNLVISSNIGIDVAPWNVSQYQVSSLGEKLMVNLQPMHFYHFHQFEMFDDDSVSYSYGYWFREEVISLIYHPYEKELRQVLTKIRQIDPAYVVDLQTSLSKKVKSSVIKPLASYYWAIKTYLSRRQGISYPVVSWPHPVVLQINGADSGGGANQVARQLFEGNKEKYSSLMLVESRSSQDPSIFSFSSGQSKAYGAGFYVASIIDDVFGLQYKGARIFLGRSYSNLAKQPAYRQADLVHLHNLHGNYFDLDNLKQICGEKKVVWTLQDAWSINGHCPVLLGCNRWRGGKCPPGCTHHSCQLPVVFDSFDYFLRRKADLYKGCQIHLVTASDWLKKLVEKSILADHPVTVIHNGTDTDVFSPTPKLVARRLLGLPPDRDIFLFAANFGFKNPWKGGEYVKELISSSQFPTALYVALGNPQPSRDSKLWQLPFISDRKLLALYYSAADLLIYPSLADTCPLHVIESMACGTPVVSFATGGIPEIISHHQDGYLARYKQLDDLVRGIEWLKSNPSILAQVSHQARQKIRSQFTTKHMTRSYQNLYSRLLSHNQ